MAMMLVFILFASGTLTAFAYSDYPADDNPDDCDEYAIEHTPDIGEDEIEHIPDICEDDSYIDAPPADNSHTDDRTEAYATVTTMTLMAEPPILGQVSTFAELQDAIDSAVNGEERRIEIIADFPFETAINIQRDKIITLYTSSGIHNLTAPVGERHFTVQGTLNLQGGVELIGNGGNGGGVDNSGRFNMSGSSSINGNLNHSTTDAAYGGGVQNRGTLTMTDFATIRNNTVLSDSSAAYGGGVNFGHGTIALSGNAQIINNTAISITSAVYGGGIYQHGGIVTMTDNAAIIGNSVRSDAGSTAVGGGIHSGYTATLNMSGNASIRDNSASIGGGVWMSYSNSVMTVSGNASIADNSASESGGGIHLGFDSTLQMNGGSITGNTARNGGGVSFASSSFANIANGTISGNTAQQRGGGIMGVFSNLTVGDGAVFSENRADMAFPYRNPADDSIYEQNIKGSQWTSPFVQGYNNFDIGYQNFVTVAFDSNCGNPSLEGRRIAFGTAIGTDMPSDPTRADFVFIRWDTQRDGMGIVFDGTSTVMASMTVFAIWEAVPPPQQGRVNITNVSDGNRERLSGAVFGVYHALSDEKIAAVTANSFGEATVLLDAGDYYLRQLTPPSGYQHNMERHSFRIRTGAITEVTVVNRLIPAETPPPATRQGSLLVTAVAENDGERLSSVRFSVYHSQTNVAVATLITDRFGEAFIELPAGDYSLRQTAVPSGFILKNDRIGFRIGENRLAEVTVKLRQIPNAPETETAPPATPSPTPDPAPTPIPVIPPNQSQPPAQNQTPSAPPAGSPPSSTQRPTSGGNVQIVARAEQSGNLLQGAVFAVYRVSDNTRLTELTTGANGQVTHQLAPGEYYLRQQRATFGYLPETSRIFFTVENGKTVVVEVTNQRDMDVPYAEGGNIALPQTGEQPPFMNYILGTLLLVFALLCGIGVISQRKPNKRNRKNRRGMKAYA